MKVIFISSGDPENRRQWSGTVSYMFEELQKNNEIIIADIQNASNKAISLFGRCLNKIFSLFGKKYSSSYSTLEARRASRIVQRIIDQNPDADAVFCISRSGAISYIHTDIPVVYLCDATYDLLKDYYPHLTGMGALTDYEANVLEKKALEHSTAVICASKWVQESVVEHYNYRRGATKVIEFGANCSEVEYRPKTELSKKLLFCGVEWQRKGGQIALDTVRELNRRGIDVELYIAGLTPPVEIFDPFVHIEGFLNKNISSEAMRLEQLYCECDLLILPTVAECAGIVFAEAASRGLPSIAFNTGGVGNYVIDKRSGYTLPLGSDHNAFADIIERLYNDTESFLALGADARKCYLEFLNWEHWGKETQGLLESVVNNEDRNNDLSQSR